MKRITRITVTALSILMLIQGLAGCSAKRDSQSIPGSEDSKSIESAVAGASLSSEVKTIVTLKNHMTEQEKSQVTEGPLQVLDEPWNLSQEKKKESDPYKEGVFLEIWEREDQLRDIEERPEEYSYMTAEEMEEYKKNTGRSYAGAIVDGRSYATMIVPAVGNDDYYGIYYVRENGQLVIKEIKDFEDLKKRLPEILEEYTKDEYKYYFVSDCTDREVMEKDILRIFQAADENTYQKLPIRTTKQRFDKYLQDKANQEQDLSWELDKDAVKAIKDQVTEYHFYDEGLDRELVVHVAIPKGHESSAVKALSPDVQPEVLPALVLTDAVWRFNDIAKLLDEMEAGRAKPQILISIGQDYSICNSENMERSAVFCEGKDKFLDFITDDLMPYLSEKYNIDFENSTLFGHSLGGVFAHYAAFNSDRYENQPFGKYIIGSPAFWSPYSTEMKDFKDQKNDYGYFDRNQAMNKKILITGGTDENEDYQEYFGENDSTLDAIAHLEERVNAHCDPANSMARSKLYKSHHYQYIPDMLKEYVDEKI